MLILKLSDDRKKRMSPYYYHFWYHPYISQLWPWTRAPNGLGTASKYVCLHHVSHIERVTQGALAVEETFFSFWFWPIRGTGFHWLSRHVLRRIMAGSCSRVLRKCSRRSANVVTTAWTCGHLQRNARTLGHLWLLFSSRLANSGCEVDAMSTLFVHPHSTTGPPLDNLCRPSYQ